ncbi:MULTISPECIES: hypothetical protein [unclassified Corynebacterium]|jgi:hypothetical protein|uniref:hypothetical protein n=1 Tax=unclassified Corynebacterium TaxID=2624378 RepID=UPI0003B8CFA4|nr:MULTISPECIES: hypothetical protein [unclassified Corynebacterium]ERS51118.1 hypothetical protein HMPREF1281_01793 [Corynebacterium sp. KPL1855]ERS61657.1 hypothetical protein HMPREF1257_01896 [Corynebacterium sp. KPL1814]ERS79934.1 hypothetical protein HMPREF1285_01043 [Corynebacterium sp. KPL1859]
MGLKPLRISGEGKEELYSAPHTWYFGAEIKRESGWEFEFAGRSRFQLLLLALTSPRAREALRALEELNISNFHKVVLATEGENFSSSLDRAYGILRKKFAVIEYFPYHSEKADDGKNNKFELPSQECTEYLLEQAYDSGASIYLTRSIANWGSLTPKLFEHGERLIIASSNSNITFTPKSFVSGTALRVDRGIKIPTYSGRS